MDFSPAPGHEPEAEGVSPVVEKRAVDRRWIFFFLLVLMLVIDQAIKLWTRSALNVHQSPGYPWPGVFEITYSRNEGIAFGLMQGKGGLFTPIAVAIAFGAGFYSWRHPRENTWVHVAMGLLASGALGNLYDRLRFGWVTDMFWFKAINFPVFNWADSCITVATILLIIVWTKDALPHRSAAKPVKPAIDES